LDKFLFKFALTCGARRTFNMLYFDTKWLGKFNMCVSSCGSTKSIENSVENFTVSILGTVYNNLIGTFLYIVAVKGQFDVMVTWNVYTVRKKMCVATIRHADRRGKPLFFAHLELSHFLDHKNHSPLPSPPIPQKRAV